jgi:hypothetical protein
LNHIPEPAIPDNGCPFLWLLVSDKIAYVPCSLFYKPEGKNIPDPGCALRLQSDPIPALKKTA